MTGFGGELYRQIGDVGIETRKLVAQTYRSMPPVTDLRRMLSWRNIVPLPYALFTVDFLDKRIMPKRPRGMSRNSCKRPAMAVTTINLRNHGLL